MEDFFEKRIIELASASESRYTFTKFLSLAEVSSLLSLCLKERYELFGGREGCERMIAKFGDPDKLCYAEDFPIKILEIKPKSDKFADELSHRDILGGILSLGIDREYTGDIFLKDNKAYCFVYESMAGFICDNLKKVKHTDILCRIIDELPPDLKPEFERKPIIVSSERLDCILSAVYDISRNESERLIKGGMVFINGVLCEKISHSAEEGDIISVRHKGRFIYRQSGRYTRKGRICADAEIYK